MITGFPPIAEPNAQILILGSIPGIASLEKQEYYAHPRNSFWPFIEKFTHSELGTNYEKKKAVLVAHRIALWDVLKMCQREGSLDSSIESQSIVSNDFESFYANHCAIKFVLFNGVRAEKEYKKHVFPIINHQFQHLEYHRLPSTSPAMAQLTKQEKLLKWLTVMGQIKADSL